MMNDNYEPPRDLSYGFDPSDLKFDDDVMDMAPDQDVFDKLCELVDADYVRNDPDAANRTLNMALALYERVVNDPTNAFEGLSRNELFGASLYQAIVWECG
jgi:hypothetical protein